MREHPNLQRDRNIQILKDYIQMKRKGVTNIHALLSIKYGLSVSRIPQIIKAMSRRMEEELLTNK